MSSFNDYLAGGHAWSFVPVAVILGILHGLEPGHSKTMMTAFIVAIRGTVGQAFLLGLSATISHTAIIWVLAFVGLHYSSVVNVEGMEPYFKLATGLIVIGLAGWIFYRTRQARLEAHHHEHEDHDHDDHLEFGDAHERQHARELEKHLENGHVTTSQIILFGLTGGLLPCPSAFAVLLLCLQLKRFTLGFALVLAFSIGLAVTLVGVGVIAAVSVKHVSRKFAGFAEWARLAPYISSAVLALVGLLVVLQGLGGISR
ncbi:MAG: sulfite exporter TauE/SafE family protein [Candidatus Omnitrophica bacterium]|nr:sulfite exporter TauE/SafE family protein [Candidatus Omnitrophota bacterium]MDE2222409.1 sulfite exporter TauE/SafE family protein [Candidatus Omnitrophota bacterium]